LQEIIRSSRFFFDVGRGGVSMRCFPRSPLKPGDLVIALTRTHAHTALGAFSTGGGTRMAFGMPRDLC
jgi:hypothetical protein